jgi:hypothetical protein
VAESASTVAAKAATHFDAIVFLLDFVVLGFIAAAHVIRHPEVAAKRPSKDAAEDSRAVALRGSLRSHLRVTEMNREEPDYFAGMTGNST